MLLKAILAAIYAPFTLLPLYFLNYALIASYRDVPWQMSLFLLLMTLAFFVLSINIVSGVFASSQLKVTEEVHCAVVRLNNLVIITSMSFSFFFLWDKNLIGSLLSSIIGGVIALATYMAAGILECRMVRLKEAKAEPENV